MRIIVLVIIAAATLLFACNSNNNSEADNYNVSLSGSIINCEGKTIFVEQLHTDKVTKLDSVTIDPDNSFSISMNLDATGFYLLRIDKENVIYLVLTPGDSIVIEGTYGKLAANYTVKGSADCEIARVLNQHMIGSAGKLEEFNRIYQAALEDQKIRIEEVMKDLDEQALALFEADKNFLKEFILKHEKSPVIYLALFQQLSNTRILNPEADADIYTFTLEKLKEHHPNLPQTTALEKQLADYRQKTQSAPKTIAIGSEAPDINLPDENGNNISLYDLRGQYVLLDFWASWCRPCRVESPVLVKAYEKYHSKGFTIYQVSLDSNRDQWIQAIKDDNLDWFHVSDLKYWDCAPAKVYGVNGIPANYLLDKNGIIVATNLRGDALEQKLAEILK